MFIGIPFEIARQMEAKPGDDVLVQIRKVSEEQMRKEELFHKFQYYGQKGSITMENEKIGVIDDIFATILPIKGHEILGNKSTPLEYEVPYGFVYGYVNSKLFEMKHGYPFESQMIHTVCLECDVYDREKNKYHIKIPIRVDPETQFDRTELRFHGMPEFEITPVEKNEEEK